VTLIIGIACSDGVVLGSDSAVTSTDSRGQPTIRDSTPNKIRLISPHVMMTGTGLVSMSQMAADQIKGSLVDGKNLRRSSRRYGNELGGKILDLFTKSGAVRLKTGYGMLVAAPCNDEPALFSVESAGDYQAHLVESDHPYVALGSGQAVAETLLRLCRRALWRGAQPDLTQGLFAMTLALKLGCEMAAFGVSEPIHLATLTRPESSSSEKVQWQARRLTNDEREELLQDVENSLEHFSMYQDIETSEPPKGP